MILYTFRLIGLSKFIFPQYISNFHVSIDNGLFEQIKQPMPHSLTWELTEVTLPVKQPKAPERWSCTVCQVEATSEQNLQEHLVGQKHQSKVLSLNRNNGGRHLTTTHALQQEQSTVMDYVHL